MPTRLDLQVQRLQRRGYTWPIPWEAVSALAYDEDCRTSAYPCDAGRPTIGWGQTRSIELGMVWTEDECDLDFYKDVRIYTAKVAKMAGPNTNVNQLGAMVRFSWNCGLEGFAKSSFLKLHLQGNFLAAAEAIGLWNKARNTQTGQLEVKTYLVARRARERAMYLTPAPDTPGPARVQAVEPESKLTQSPINRAAATGGVVTASATVAQMVEPLSKQVGELSGTAAMVKGLGEQVQEFLGFPPIVLALVAVVGISLYIIHWRNEQRRQGRA